MDDDVKVTVELFDKEKYEKNIKENDFSMKEKNGIGVDENGIN